MRIGIVNDLPIAVEILRRILVGTGEHQLAWVAMNGAEAVAQCRLDLPDLILMDLTMPVMDGIEATRVISEGSSATKVLVLTTFDLDEYVYDAMRAGASGFLLKDAPREQLVAAVRVVARGESLLAPAITRRLVERFVSMPPPSTGIPTALAALSVREREVLQLIAQGLSNAEIAAHLFLGEATVKTHVAKVLQKLKLRDRVQAVVLAYETGFARPGDAAPV